RAVAAGPSRASAGDDHMPTMREIARAAGVASSTVSHVFNDTAPISEETRARVLEVARQMGYTRARRRRRNPGAVGLIVDGITFGQRATMILGALEYLQAKGVRALIAARDGSFTKEQSLDDVAKDLGLRNIQGA